jgi:hypothetical protein
MPETAVRRSRRGLIFAGIVVVCVAVGLGSALIAALQARDDRRTDEHAASVAHDDVGTLLASGDPYVVFRASKPELPGSGQLSVAALRGADPGPALPLRMNCARVAFAAGHGLCLQQAGPVAFTASILGPRLTETASVRLNGLPSRTRISPDGRMGTVTAFVRGHSYITSGAFSTRTTLINLTSGATVADLERFTVTRNGRKVTAADRNFWGVTFAADSNTFYATMATGGSNYLIEGNIRERTAHTIRDEVECPSLSPDGTRVAYKHLERLPAGVGWRLHVYDLRSGRDTPLAETEGIDDQASWLDDGRVLYAKKDDTWVVPADGHGAPRVWMRNGVSPVIVRP